MAGAVLSLPGHGQAQVPVAPVVQAEVAAAQAPPADWRRSLEKALTYQTIVVTTDQLLYWTIVTGTSATELVFFVANAMTGVGYYVAFDEVWAAAGLDPAPGDSQVSVGKAVAYRVFDTARVFGITLAVGTPIVASLEVTAAIAATRTVIYMLHDYAWSWADSPQLHKAGTEIAGWIQQTSASPGVAAPE